MPATNAYRNRRPQTAIWQHHQWRTYTRPTVLARANHTCEWPAGCTNKATIADHYPTPAITILQTQGLRAALNPDTCRALCHHHSGKADGPRAHTKGGHHTPAPHLNHPGVKIPLPAVEMLGTPTLNSRAW